ncbi:hypothetical protein HDU79_010562 [Rhizoclosmatium sp. JEL0117]|nr:hypothetical protein HDU79_010562 [Rhizoclosmatium sp. JEL0117]
MTTTTTSTTYTWSPKAYSQHASFVPQLGTPILEALAPKPGERIMDIGCGDGILTERIRLSGAIVVANDASPDMIHQAKENFPDSADTYSVLDGHDLHSSEWGTATDKFDAVFSNAALHWMKKSPTQVVRGIRAVLKSNHQGRFVAEFGGFLNIASVHAALINGLNKRGFDGRAVSPWYFPSPAEYKLLLEENGFTDVTATLVGRPTVLLEAGLKGWLDTFGMAFMDVLGSDEEREELKNEIVEQLRPVLCDSQGVWTLDYWRLRVEAWTH